MNDALSVYLHDHVAGAVFGVELVEALAHDHERSELGRQAAVWEIEIKTDQATLRDIAGRLGLTAGTVKDAISWIAEKATRLKLRRKDHSDLGTFETLETLALGILGKEKLWRALRTAAMDDPRLAGIDFEALERRAREQHQSVETQRLVLAKQAFTPRDRPSNY